MTPLPTAVPVDASTPAPSSTATAVMPTLVPPALAGSVVAQRVPRDVSFIELFSGSPNGADAYSKGAEPTVEDVLEKGLRLAGASPVHVAVRGTASSDTVRCDWRGIARSAEQRNRAIRFWLGLDADDAIPDAAFMEALFAATMDVLDPAYRETAKSNFDVIARGGLSTEYLFLTCYANYTVSEYLLGSGPGTLTVAYDRMGEAHSYELYEKEYWNGRFDDVLPSRAEYEALLLGRVTAAEESLRARIGDHEGVVFLAPMGAHNAIAVESWQAVEQWDVQTVEGVVNVVRYGAGVGDPEHTQTLSGLRTRIRTAVGSSSGTGGAGVVSGQVDPPPSGGVVSGQSDSSGGTGGASGQSSSTTSSTSAPACPTPSAGSSASAATATATPAPATPTPTPTRIANVSGLRGYYQSIGAYCFIGPYPTVTATATSTPTALSGGGGASGQTGSDATATATATPTPTHLHFALRLAVHCGIAPRTEDPHEAVVAAVEDAAFDEAVEGAIANCIGVLGRHTLDPVAGVEHLLGGLGDVGEYRIEQHVPDRSGVDEDELVGVGVDAVLEREVHESRACESASERPLGHVYELPTFVVEDQEQDFFGES